MPLLTHEFTNLYLHMVPRNGWATAAEVEAAAILLNIHVILEDRNVYISQT